MFMGFSKDTIDFFYGLRENNHKEWFEANRHPYQKHVQEPLQELVKELGPFMLTIDPFFEINPKKCISRIYRDVRFSHDKSPYRSNMWLAFKRIYKDWKAEPVYFFEIFPDFYRYGMGFYDIPRESLEALRQLILEKDKSFTKINAVYQGQNEFVMEGEKYKRILNQEISDDLKDWYQRKEIYFVCNKNIDERLFSTGISEDIINGFKVLEPIYHFFLKLRGHGPAGV